MKTLISLFSVIVLLAQLTVAQTNFFTNVTNLWYQGYKSNVLAIAEQRLQQNTNDIAGLLLKVEYQVEFFQFSQLTNTMNTLLTVSESYTGSNFLQRLPVLREDLDVMRQFSTNYPSGQLEVDLQKTNQTGKIMSFTISLEALQKDGYFE